jgi:hypothetical protein
MTFQAVGMLGLALSMLTPALQAAPKTAIPGTRLVLTLSGALAIVSHRVAEAQLVRKGGETVLSGVATLLPRLDAEEGARPPVEEAQRRQEGCLARAGVGGPLLEALVEADPAVLARLRHVMGLSPRQVQTLWRDAPALLWAGEWLDLLGELVSEVGIPGETTHALLQAIMGFARAPARATTPFAAWHGCWARCVPW